MQQVANYHLHYKQLFYSPLIQDNQGKPVLSQRRNLLEQPLDFYEPDVLRHSTYIVKALQENPVVCSSSLHTTVFTNNLLKH